MKTRMFQKTLALVVAGGMAVVAVYASAQNSPVVNAAPQMPPGLAEIVQLSQAKVGDETMIAYIKQSGNSYSLNAAQIIYLHQNGISDAVISAMLSQARPMAATSGIEVSAASTPPPAAPPAVASQAVAPAPTAPSVTYVQTPPATYYYPPDYSYAYPAYYPAYGWGVPPVAFSFGWGWGGRWGGGGHWGGHR
jgi:hypothetical protein